MTTQRITRKYLAARYGWDSETLTRKLRMIGIRHSKKLSEVEIDLIYSQIGTPEQRDRFEREMIIS